MKKRKIKLFASVASLALVVAVMGVGVWAATSATATVKTKVGFTATGVAGTLDFVDGAGAGLTNATTYGFGIAFSGTVTAKGTSDSPIASDTSYTALTQADSVANVDAAGEYYISSQAITLQLANIAFTSDGSSTLITKEITVTFKTDSTMDAAAYLHAGTCTANNVSFSNKEVVVMTTDATNWPASTEIVTTSGDNDKNATNAAKTTGIITAKLSATDATATKEAGTAGSIKITFTYYGTGAKTITAQDVSLGFTIDRTAPNT